MNTKPSSPSASKVLGLIVAAGIASLVYLFLFSNVLAAVGSRWGLPAVLGAMAFFPVIPLFAVLGFSLFMAKRNRALKDHLQDQSLN